MIGVMAVLGAVLGSFACCQAWRMRYREVGSAKGKRRPAKVGKTELGARSVCLSCGAQLKWYDNIPVVSWLMLRGRCRTCGAKIGVAEIMSEVLGAVGYGLVGWWFSRWVGAGELSLGGEWWQWAELLVLMVAGVGMMILAVYDAKWGRMPVRVLTFLNACAIIMVILRWQAGLLVASDGGGRGNVWSLMGAVGILAGVYYLLYVGSRERWVGSGDWLLGLAMALMLGDWRLALVEMLVANVLTLGVAVWQRTRGEKAKAVALGPGMIVGFVMVWVAQEWILGWFSL